MLDFSNASLSITKETILSKVSEYDIFNKYCEGFEKIDKSFCSEFREDRNPGCYVYITKLNELRYKDFASGEHLDCFGYVMAKFNCSFLEANNIIACDFGLGVNKIDFDPLLINLKPREITPYIKQNSFINIVSQPFNITDYSYWNQYEINFETLESFDVFSAKYVYLIKGDKRYVFEYTKSNPIYAYRFEHEGEYSYKIYKPFSDKKGKWMFSGGVSNNVEGYDNLPLSGDTLVLTKSLKDVMCYYNLGIPAISLQGEANKFDNDLFVKLSKRFKRIIVNYDNDEQGVISASKITRQYDLKCYYIDKVKDLSDYIKAFGINEARIMINNKINGYKIKSSGED